MAIAVVTVFAVSFLYPTSYSGASAYLCPSLLVIEERLGWAGMRRCEECAVAVGLLEPRGESESLIWLSF
jgi:hypothetical protein